MKWMERNLTKTFFGLLMISMLVNWSCKPGKGLLKNNKSNDSPLLIKLLGEQSGFFDSILRRRDDLRIQVIYSHLEKKDSGIQVTNHFFHVNDSLYFYPASAIKLPVALLALQRLHEMDKTGVNLYSSMLTGADGDGQTSVSYDSTSPDGHPSIAQYIRKILLVSDNDAFNRLYEFLGQEYINTSLHNMGYTDAQIIHRLSISLAESQNRHTNPVQFLDKNGNLIFSQPPRQSGIVYKTRDIKLGKGYMNGQTLVQEPFDFSQRNRLSLTGLHNILRSLVLPETVEGKMRFNLDSLDRSFLLKYLSMYPRQSGIEAYRRYPDNYVKSFLFDTNHIYPGLRIYSKSGTAYGFLTDVAYITDSIAGVEFLLSATIYCNGDGIFNDDKYDYETIGYPFLSKLAQVIYEYERKQRTYKQ